MLKAYLDDVILECPLIPIFHNKRTHALSTIKQASKAPVKI